MPEFDPRGRCRQDQRAVTWMSAYEDLKASCLNSQIVVHLSQRAPRSPIPWLIFRCRLISEFVTMLSAARANAPSAIDTLKRLCCLCTARRAYPNHRACSWGGDLRPDMSRATADCIAEGHSSVCRLERGLRDIVISLETKVGTYIGIGSWTISHGCSGCLVLSIEKSERYRLNE